MTAAIHVDRAVALRVGNIEDVDALELRQLEDLEPVRRHELTRSARRLAARVRFAREREALAIVGELSCPWLQRNLIDVHARGLRGVGLVRLRVDDEVFVSPLP